MNTSARRNRTSPGRWTSYALGATAAATLLATTACGHGTVKDAEGSTSSERPSASASAKPGGASADAGGTSAGSGGASAGSTKGTNGTSGTGRTGGKGTTGGTGGTSATGRTSSTGSGGGTAGGTGGGGKAAIVPCTQKELGVSAVKERDARHLALTVQNASTEKCNLYGYPTVQLGADAQFTTPVIKDSDGTPGEPVTLDPGQEAYAALLVSSGTTNEYAAKSITLSLQGPTPGSSADGPIDVPLPVGTLYADNSQLVTYWTTASGFALRFIMSK
ncbi:DUF4232 domain-containing protein [Streptomyces aureus]|uniref:DUF4232 domain-containing protein n=1 Tax=Streptomyces aureus TaxID=193461 RepID=UPI00099D0DBF|nr:DUF4232 domain-containing protein [Streptomyces aureus]